MEAECRAGIDPPTADDPRYDPQRAVSRDRLL
jgi:hypothetical protein